MIFAVFLASSDSKAATLFIKLSDDVGDSGKACSAFHAYVSCRILVASRQPAAFLRTSQPYCTGPVVSPRRMFGLTDEVDGESQIGGLLVGGAVGIAVDNQILSQPSSYMQSMIL